MELRRNWIHFSVLISLLLKGKAGSPGERGPPGKPVSIVYLVDIFPAEMLFQGFNYPFFFLFFFY